MRHERRLVGLTALRHGGEIRRIGLYEQPVERNSFGGFADIIRRAERDDPRKRNIVSEIEKFFAEPLPARKGMDDSAGRDSAQKGRRPSDIRH